MLTATLPKFAPLIVETPVVKRARSVFGVIDVTVGIVYVSVFVVGVTTHPLTRTTDTDALSVAATWHELAPGTFATVIVVPPASTTPVVSAWALVPDSKGVPVAATKRTVTVAFGGRLAPESVIPTGASASTVVGESEASVGAV